MLKWYSKHKALSSTSPPKGAKPEKALIMELSRPLKQSKESHTRNEHRVQVLSRAKETRK
jgi:hypothetical protein